MDEEQLKEYTIKVSFTEIISTDEETTRTVEAYSEDEAMDMIEDKLYKEYDEIDNISHDVLSVKSCAPGHRDDETRDMFKGDKK